MPKFILLPKKSELPKSWGGGGALQPPPPAPPARTPMNVAFCFVLLPLGTHGLGAVFSFCGIPGGLADSVKDKSSERQSISSLFAATVIRDFKQREREPTRKRQPLRDNPNNLRMKGGKNSGVLRSAPA